MYKQTGNQPHRYVGRCFKLIKTDRIATIGYYSARKKILLQTLQLFLTASVQKGRSFPTRKTPTTPDPETTRAVAEDLREHTMRRAKLFGVIWVMLVISDLVTVSTFWHIGRVLPATRVELEAKPP